MKPLVICLTLALTVPALPGATQTNSAQASTASEATQALANQLLGLGRNAHHSYRTPEQKAREAAELDKINDLIQAGTEALHNKNFVTAEADYRQLVQVTTVGPQMASETMLGPSPYYGLGEALAGQGKTAEAIAAYKLGIYYPLNFSPEAVAVSQAIENKPNLRGCSFPTDAVAWMKYALLLSQTGQSAEAFSVYTQALHHATDTAHPEIKLSFHDAPPTPTELQAAAHIALGLLVNDTGNDREQAMTEFDQALRLAPDAAVTNYYYGYGWQRLDPKSPTRAATALQAKAALTKATASEDDNVRKAAEEAMKRMP